VADYRRMVSTIKTCIMQKEVVYQSTNTYDTLNEFTEETKTVWLVFHGIGYLSRYFIRLFQNLNPQENYIIAPQAPSKYYKNNEYKKVGTSWLTKENTKTETTNVLHYIDGFVIVSGGFPKELDKEALAFLDKTTRVIHIVGENDPYFENDKVAAEKIRVQRILPQIEFRTHPGGHELNIETLDNIV